MGVECMFFGGDPTQQEKYDGEVKEMAKVKIMDIHPSKNWVITSDEKSVITLWNYADQELVKYITMQELMDQQRQGGGDVVSKSDIFTSYGSERSTGPEKYSPSRTGMSTRPGAIDSSFHGPSPPKDDQAKVRLIRDVKFYDQHVLRWRCSCAAIAPSASFTPPDWIVIVCNQRVILVHPLTLQSRHITSKDLQGKSPLCCEIVSSSLLALGCSDGQVRLWDWRNWVLVKSLKAHSKACANLLNVMPQDTNNSQELVSEDELEGFMRLVSVGQDGSCLLWDIHYTGNIIEGDSPAARIEGTLYGGVKSNVLIDLVYNPFMDSLVAAVGERKVYVWDLSQVSRALLNNRGGSRNTRLQSKSFLRGKGSQFSGDVLTIPRLHKVRTPSGLGALKGLASFQHPHYPLGAMLACSKGSLVGVVSASSSGVSMGDGASDNGSERTTKGDSDGVKADLLESFDVQKLFPGLSKKLKVYTFQQHPLRNHVLFCGTNVGLFVLSMEQTYASTYALHSSWHVSQPLLTFLKFDGGAVKAMTVASDKETPELREGRLVCNVETPPTLNSVGGLPKIGFTATSRNLSEARLFPSPSGRYLGIYSQTQKFYKVVEIETRGGVVKSQKDIDQGACLGFAWVGMLDSFAIIEPPVVVAAERKKKSLFSFRKNKSQEADNFVGDPTLTIKDIHTASGISKSTSEISLGGVPALLMGGTALCIAFEDADSDPSVDSKGTGQAAAVAQTSLEGTKQAPVGFADQETQTKYQFSEGSLLKTMAGTAVKDAQFFHWQHETSQLVALTATFPCPSLVVWDEEGRTCALFAPKLHRFVIYSAYPTFRRVCSFPALARSGELPVSANWICNCLFFSTCVEIYVAFPHWDTDFGAGGIAKAGALCVPLASNAVLPSLITGSKSRASSFLPIVQPVRGIEGYGAGSGPQVLGIWKGDLLIGLSGQVLSAIDLSHPMLRLGMQVKASQPEKALKWAHAFELHEHDTIALFFEEHGFVDQAIQVPGISSSLYLDLCLKHKKVDPILDLIAKGLTYIDLCDTDPDCATILSSAFMPSGTNMPAIIRISVFLVQNQRKEVLRDLLKLCLTSHRFEDAQWIALLFGETEVSMGVSMKNHNWGLSASLLLGSQNEDTFKQKKEDIFQNWNQSLSNDTTIARFIDEQYFDSFHLVPLV